MSIPLNSMVPPQNLEAEQSILGTALLKPNSVFDILSEIKQSDFYKQSHALIFAAIVDLSAKSEPIDTLTVCNHLKNIGRLEETGGAAYLASLASIVPVASHIKGYTGIVREAALKRRIIFGFSGGVESAYNGTGEIELLNDINDLVLSLRIDDKSDPVLLKDILPAVIDEIDERSKNRNTVHGISTGLEDLDNKTGGLQKSNYIVVAGRPGMGKTSLALKFAESASKANEGVLFFSLEMNNKRLVHRLLSMESKVDSRKFRNGYMGEDDWPKLTHAYGQIIDRPIIIDHSSGLTIAQLTSRAKKAAMRHDIGVIVVDYIQLMKGSRGSENRTRELTEISRGLLALAKDLDIALVVLSQLNRNVESRSEKRPVISDLKESGAMEEDADVVMLLYRDEIYNKNPDNPERGIAEIIIGKGRDIGNWTIKAAFRGETHEFMDLVQS